MSLELRSDGGYSNTEQKIFAALLRLGPIDSDQLTHSIYGDKRRKPRYARTAIVGAARSLSDKITDNREPFRIKSSGRRGPYPMEFWIEER